MACSPATPAPSIKTREGVIVPAAVMNMGKSLGEASAAASTALYPAMVAMELSASILWARVVRGMSSMEKTVSLRSASSFMISGWASGSVKEIRVVPSLSASRSAAGKSGSDPGPRTMRTMSAWERRRWRSCSTLAPWASKSASLLLMPSPAPASITTSNPALVRAGSDWEMSAIRFSPGYTSFGTATIIVDLLERFLKCTSERIPRSPPEADCRELQSSDD